jgi:ABC-type multidrug transport system fused ATPase/permease subunit
MKDTSRVILSLLTPRQKRQACLQGCLILIGMVFEAASLGAIMPVGRLFAGGSGPGVTVLLPTWLLDSYPSLRHQPLFWGLGILLLLGVAKAVVSAFVIWQQSKFVANVALSVSCRLMASYLRRPWTFHMQHNSSQLIATATTEVTIFTQAVASMIIVVTEVVVFCGLAGLLFWLSPLAAVTAVTVFGVATVVFQKIVDVKMRQWSKRRQHYERERLKHLQEGLHAIKPIKVSGRESFFQSRFEQSAGQAMLVWQRQNAIFQYGRLWYELVAVATVVVLTAVLFWSGMAASAVLPILALFAAAAFRLLPSAARLLSNAQTVENAAPAVHAIATELAWFESQPAVTRDTLAAGAGGLTVEDISYRYPDSPVNVLSDVSLSIAPGSTVGILGGSGAGKSTLVDVILSLLTPTRGRVAVDGIDVHSPSAPALHGRVGYVPQTIYLLDDTIRRNIVFGLDEADVSCYRIEEVLAATRLTDFIATLPDGIDTAIGEQGVRLSGGQRQRIGIARALYQNPSILILDEATSALDIATEAEVMAAINSMHGQKTIIIIAHRLSTLADCDIVYRLEGGRVVASGSPAEILPQMTA